jgi:hypothetical protein
MRSFAIVSKLITKRFGRLSHPLQPLFLSAG